MGNRNKLFLEVTHTAFVFLDFCTRTHSPPQKLPEVAIDGIGRHGFDCLRFYSLLSCDYGDGVLLHMRSLAWAI